MKTVFILGASMLQVPAIKKAKEKGLYVYALDYNPEAVGIEYADEFLEISTIDKEAVYEAALRYKPDYIMTSTSDMPVRTVSWVCEKLGKRADLTYENAMCATDKSLMRDRMRECGVPIPMYFKISTYQELLEVIDKVGEKFVLKPTDNAASRGVICVDKNNEPDYKSLFDYCIKNSRAGFALVEEYMDGPEVSVEAFSIGGQPHVITITDKLVTELPFFVELGHTEPSRLPNEVQKEIRRVACHAIRAIGVINGPTHTELKVTSSGVKVVEIAARLGGDFITSRLVPLSTGVDLIECSHNSMVGEKVELKPIKERGTAIRFITGQEGVIKSINGLDEARQMPGVTEVEIYNKVGDYVHSTESSSDRIGHVIAVGKDADEAAYNAKKAMSIIDIEICCV